MEARQSNKRAGVEGQGDTKKRKQAAAPGTFKSNKRHRHEGSSRRKESMTAHAAQTRKCQHGRRRSQCMECGGSSICHHRRIRSRCKDCRAEAPTEAGAAGMEALDEA